MKLKFLHVQAENSKYSDLKMCEDNKYPTFRLFRKKTGQVETLYIFPQAQKMCRICGLHGIASQIYLRGNPCQSMFPGMEQDGGRSLNYQLRKIESEFPGDTSSPLRHCTRCLTSNIVSHSGRKTGHQKMVVGRVPEYWINLYASSKRRYDSSLSIMIGTV